MREKTFATLRRTVVATLLFCLLFAVSAFAGDYAVSDAEINRMVQELRDGIVKRQKSITVDAKASTTNLNPVYYRMMELLYEHTGKSTEGDYMDFNLGVIQPVSEYYYDTTGTPHFKVTFTPEYYTTAAQEQELTKAIAQLSNELQLSTKSDLEKVKAIYEYMTVNIRYDYEHDSSYKLKYTAYAALVNKYCVCQGYAGLLYRILLENGIECRCVTGEAGGSPHAWNIAKIDGKYYFLDATWDEGARNYEYFLGKAYEDHTLDEKYLAAEWTKRYPMSTKSYYARDLQPGEIANGEFGHFLQWSFHDDGTLYITGTGKMPELWNHETERYYPTEWMKNYRSDVKTVVIGKGITYIGGYNFGNHANLSKVIIPDTVTGLGERAFWGCQSLKQIDLPSGVNTVGLTAFAKCFRLQEVGISSSLRSKLDLKEVFAETPWLTLQTGCKNTANGIHAYVLSESKASCTRDGKRTYTCPCGANYSATIPAYGHVYTVKTVATTCTVDGYTSRTCQNCGDFSIVYGDKAYGHNISYKTVMPTRTTAGYVLHSCSRCNYSKKTSEVPAGSTCYEIKFNMNGGKGDFPQVLKVSGKDLTLTSSTPTRSGYTFAGWGTSTGARTVSWQAGGRFSENSTMTLYALWTNNKYPFRDVMAGAMYSSSVYYVYDNGIMTGKSGNLFAPEAKMTRAQMAAMLYKMEGSPSVTVKKAPFEDTPLTYSLTKAIAWAKSNGIVNGKSATIFDPTGDLTRQQFVAMLYKYAKYKGYDVSVASSTAYKACKDYKDVSSSFVTPVNWAYEKGLIGANGNIIPKDTIHRYEVAIIITRFMKKSM